MWDQSSISSPGPWQVICRAAVEVPGIYFRPVAQAWGWLKRLGANLTRRRPRILLVDVCSQCSPTVDLLGEMMQHSGYDAMIASDVPHAAECLRRRTPDLLLACLGNRSTVAEAAEMVSRLQEAGARQIIIVRHQEYAERLSMERLPGVLFADWPVAEALLFPLHSSGPPRLAPGKRRRGGAGAIGGAKPSI